MIITIIIFINLLILIVFLKEPAHDILEQDLPIYIACVCSSNVNSSGGGGINGSNNSNNNNNSNKTVMAQLQRVIIVTPDSSLSLTLKPMIKVKKIFFL